MLRTGKIVAGIALGLASVALLAPGKALGAADTVAVGASAPAFTLPAQDNKPVSLSDYKGKWVVLYFYPKDQTQGCSLEAHNFQRDQDKYKALNAVVLGVSLDTVESHATWCTKDSFTFKMLADPQHKVVDEYGVPLKTFQTKDGPMTIAMRQTFLISPAGKVVDFWDVKDIQGHSDAVLAAIQTGK
jgi:peroxiredoxin Q/BCP